MATPSELKIHLQTVDPETGRGNFVAEPPIVERDTETSRLRGPACAAGSRPGSIA